MRQDIYYAYYVYIQIKIGDDVNEIEMDALCHDLAEIAAIDAFDRRSRVDSDDVTDTGKVIEWNGALIPIVEGIIHLMSYRAGDHKEFIKEIESYIDSTEGKFSVQEASWEQGDMYNTDEYGDKFFVF